MKFEIYILHACLAHSIGMPTVMKYRNNLAIPLRVCGFEARPKVKRRNEIGNKAENKLVEQIAIC